MHAARETYKHINTDCISCMLNGSRSDGISCISWLQMLSEFSDDLVPLIISDKGGGPKSVRIVLTSSEEDRILLKVRRPYYPSHQFMQQWHLLHFSAWYMHKESSFFDRASFKILKKSKANKFVASELS